MNDRLIFFLKLFKENIIISSSLGFISGIIGSMVFDMKVPIITSLVMLFFILTFISDLKLKISFSIYIFFLVLSIFRVISYSQNRILGFQKGDKIEISGYLATVENNGAKKRGVITAKDISSIDKETSISNLNLAMLIEGFWDVDIDKYDKISIIGYICDSIFKPNNIGLSEEDSYIRYLKTKGIIYTVRVETISLGDTDSRKKLLRWINKAKGYINSRAKASLKEREYALTTGVIYGVDEKSNTIDDDIFRKTGTTHIVAVSGYNVAIIISSLGIVNYISNRKFYLIYSIIFVCIFSVFVGVENIPVIRASMMAIVFLFGKMIGKKKTTINTILFAVTIFLYMNPYTIGSLSFQLSFLSTIGLIYLGSKIRRKIVFVPEIIREDAASTVAAIIYTLPVSMMNFNEFSLVAIFSNILILPAVSYLTIIGLVFLIVTCFSTFIARFFSGLIYIIVEYIYSVLKVFSRLSYAMVSIDERTSILVSKVLIMILLVVTIEIIFQNARYNKRTNRKDS